MRKKHPLQSTIDKPGDGNPKAVNTNFPPSSQCLICQNVLLNRSEIDIEEQEHYLELPLGDERLAWNEVGAFGQKRVESRKFARPFVLKASLRPDKRVENGSRTACPGRERNFISTRDLLMHSVPWYPVTSCSSVAILGDSPQHLILMSTKSDCKLGDFKGNTLAKPV